MNGYELIFIFCFVATTIICTISGQQDKQVICGSLDTSVVKWTCQRIEDCGSSNRLLGSPQEYRCGSDRGQRKICCPYRAKAPGTTSTKPTPSSSANYVQVINQEVICGNLNTSVVKWTCQRIEDCGSSNRLLGSPQEYRCGSDRGQRKICCPYRAKAPATTSTKPTLQESSSSSAKYIQIINQKCTDYAKARYQRTCFGGTIFGQEENCTLVKDCRQKTETLIVGGKQVEEKEFPHMALVGYGDNSSDVVWNCGGSLISERFVLTAAHCVDNSLTRPARWLGFGLLHRDSFTPEVLNTNIFPIKKAHIHPEYKNPHMNNDIALFELEKPLEFSPRIRPVCLHTEPNILREANATIVGWGKQAAGDIDSDYLLKATIAFLSTNSCTTYYAKDNRFKNGFDGRTMICAGDTKKSTEKGTSRDTCGVRVHIVRSSAI